MANKNNSAGLGNNLVISIYKKGDQSSRGNYRMIYFKINDGPEINNNMADAKGWHKCNKTIIK